MYHAPSSELAMFHPNLRTAFFKKSDGETTAEILKNTDSLTALRIPEIVKVKWEREISGAEFTIHVGTDSAASRIVMTECELEKFHFTFIEGGFVDIEFVLRCRPTGPQAGKIYELIQTDLEVSLSPPAQRDLPLDK